jgi:hypothetical protein
LRQEEREEQRSRIMNTSTCGSAGKCLAFLRFSVEMSKKRDAPSNFSQ